MPIEYVEFVLGPPRVGYTGYVAGRSFENGFYSQSFASVELKERGIRFCAGWNAQPVDSEKGKAILEEHYGDIQIPQNGTQEPSGDDATSGGQSNGPEAAGSESDADPSQGTEGSDTSSEDGPAEVEVDERLVTAIEGLDPDNDDHWTQDGKPAIAAISEFYGSAGFTRKDVENAKPGYVRPER